MRAPFDKLGANGRQHPLMVSLSNHVRLPALTSPPSLHPSAPATLNPWTHEKSPYNPRRGATLRSQKTRLAIFNFAPKLVLSLPKSLSCQRNLIRFSPPPKFGSILALQLYITLETNTLLRHNTTPPLTAISRQKPPFSTQKTPLLSSLPVCPG